MGNKLSDILYVILIFILQMLICDYVNLGPWLYLSLMPLIVLLIPRQIRIHGTMLIAFGVGLLLDVLSDGVLGLNAASAVLVAAFREVLYKNIINGDRQDRTRTVSVRTAGTLKFIYYLLASVSIFTACYVLLDCIGSRSVGFMAMTFAISTVSSTLICFLVSYRHLKNN